MPLTLLERFWIKVDQTGDCWVWTAARNPKGYGRFFVAGHLVPAHRFAYELLVGEVPEGMQLDHTCRNHSCVNPDHLEPVTSGENTRRGLRGRMKTHCAKGHRFTTETTYIRPGNGRRMCLVCIRSRGKSHAVV